MRQYLQKKNIIITLVIVLIGYQFVRDYQDKKYIKELKTDIDSNRTVQKEQSSYLQVLSYHVPKDNIRSRKIRELVYIIKHCNRFLTDTQVYSFAVMIVDDADKYKSYDHIQLASLARQESDFNPSQISDSGAMGLFQIMPETAGDACSHLGWSYYEGIELVPEKSIAMAAWYLADRMAKHKGDYKLALASYNGGPKNAYRYHYYELKKNGVPLDSAMIKQADSLWAETRAFVPSVLKYEAEFRDLVKNIRDSDFDKEEWEKIKLSQN